MSQGKLAPLIREFYPEYYQWMEYPAVECVPFSSVHGDWGILGNFYPIRLVVDGMEYVNSEQLFQMMKFTDQATLRAIHSARGMKIKYVAKAAEKRGLRRPDWGRMVIDCMKFCLQIKYDQCEEFREALRATEGKYIVEDQSGRKNVRTVDSWGAVLVDDRYVGSNLMGRLLMELRDSMRGTE